MHSGVSLFDGQPGRNTRTTYDDSTMTMKINFWAAVAAIAGAATTLSA
jgi:hypothetical protein